MILIAGAWPDRVIKGTSLTPKIAHAGAAPLEAQMANEMNPVGWFEIYVKDMNRAKSFY